MAKIPSTYHSKSISPSMFVTCTSFEWNNVPSPKFLINKMKKKKLHCLTKKHSVFLEQICLNIFILTLLNVEKSLLIKFEFNYFSNILPSSNPFCPKSVPID